MTFAFHPEAERDIAEAMDFYAGQAGRAIAGRFLDEVERMFPLNIFPYARVYRSMENEIRILIVRHQHRKPGFGRGRR